MNLKQYTTQRHSTIVKYKTAYYTFSAPVRTGMYLANITDKQTHDTVEQLLLEMGIFFQTQDDFLDCFVNSGVSGKIGTDIQDGKCAWPLVTALQSASDAQKLYLEANYGKKDPKAVQRVKDLYAELGVEEKYYEYEKKAFEEFPAIVQEVSRKTNVPPPVFNNILGFLFKRTK